MDFRTEQEEKQKRQQRARIIYIISAALMKSIYQQQELKKKKAMANLAVENQNILGCAHPTFIFNAKWYVSPYNTILPENGRRNDFNRILHVSLMEQAQQIIDNASFDSLVIKTKIENFINKTLEISNSIADLQSLLPDCLQLPSDSVLSSVFSGDNLPQEKIDKFLQDNQSAYNAIKQIFMTDLLMAKVAV